MTRHDLSVERGMFGGHYYRCSCGWGIADDVHDYKARITQHTGGRVVCVAALRRRTVTL